MILVPQAHKDQQDLEEIQDRLEHLAVLVHKVLLDLREHLETLDRTAQQERLEHLETLEHKDLRAQ